MPKHSNPSEPTFGGFKEAAAKSGLPLWLVRKMVWEGRLASYQPHGPRGRTFIKLDDLYALMEQSRKDG